jgi:hypothetical protein
LAIACEATFGEFVLIKIKISFEFTQKLPDCERNVKISAGLENVGGLQQVTHLSIPF